MTRIMEQCIFCKIVKGEIPSYKVYEDGEFLAFLDINPVNPGHVDVITKEHYSYIFDLPDELFSGIFNIGRKLSRPLLSVTQAKRIGMVVEGFGVDHVHLHLIPINNPNELDPHRAKRASPEDLIAMLEALKGKF